MESDSPPPSPLPPYDSDPEGEESDTESVASVNQHNINWKRGSKLLQNVEITFSSPLSCPPVDRTVVIGMGPREVFTMTAIKLDPRFPNQRESVRIRRSFMYRPYILFIHLLQDRKAAQGIDRLESGIPSMTLNNIEGYLRYLRSTAGDNMAVREKLLRFYEDWWFLKKSWDMKKAQIACYDYGIMAILRMVDGRKGNESRLHPADVSAIFAIGLGSFDSQTGLASKHSAFEKRFVIRVSTCTLCL